MTQDPQLKQLIEGLRKTLRTVGSASKEQVQINQELLKVITLLESGLARNEDDARALISKVRKGLELTDDVAAGWAKERKVAKKDLDSIFIKFREIERLHGKINEAAKEYKDTLDDTNDLMEIDIDLSKKLFESYKEINVAINQSRKAVEKFGVGASEANSAMAQVINTTLAKRGLLSSIFDDMFSSLEGAEGLIGKLQSDSQTLINNLSGASVDIPLNFDLNSNELDDQISGVTEMIEIEKKARLAGLVDFFNKNEELQQNLARKIASSVPGQDIKFDIDTSNISIAGKVLEQGSKEYERAISKLDKSVVDISALSTVSEMYMDIFELIGKATDRTDDENKLLNQMTSQLDLGTQLLIRANLEHQNTLDTLHSTIEVERARLKLMSKYATTLQIAENAVVEIGHSFDYINSLLPAGIGDLLGLQKVSFTLIDAHRKGVKSFFEEIGKGSSKAEAISSYLKSFGPSLRLALTPTTLLIVGISAIFKYVSNISDKYKEMTQNMKVSLKQSSKFYEKQLDIIAAHENQFSTLEDIQAIQSAMVATSGKVFDVISDSKNELVLGLSEISKAFGYSAEEAVNIQKIFENLGASEAMGLRLQEDLGLMSELAGLSPQIIAQDMIDSSEEVYTYFAGMPEQAARAIIQVRRLGMSLKQAGSIAQKMLDLEGFMTDMYELQAMTGGGIDFSSAFDKGLMGNIEGMTNDIMREIGSTAELNKMDYMTRMKIAKTLGMSVEDLSKSVMLREKMNDLGPEEAAQLDANLDRMGDISNMSKDQIKDRLKQLQSTDRLAIAWDKIKAIFIKSLLPLVEVFANVLDSISPILDLIIIPLKIIGAIIKAILPAANLLLLPFKLLGILVDALVSGIESIPDRLKSFFSPLEKIVSPITSAKTGLGQISESLGTIGGLVKSVGSALAAWYIGKKVVSGGLKPMQEFLGNTLKKIPLVGSLFKKSFGEAEKGGVESADATQKALNKITVTDLDVARINLPPVEIPTTTMDVAPVVDPIPPPNQAEQEIVRKVAPNPLPEPPPGEQKVVRKLDPAPLPNPSPTEQSVIRKVSNVPLPTLKPIEQTVLQNIKKDPSTIALKPIKQTVIQSPQTNVFGSSAAKAGKKKKETVEVNLDTKSAEKKSGTFAKSVRSVMTKTLAGIAFDSVKSLLPLGESGNEALDSIANHASVLFGGMDIFGGIFENLEYGIKKVFMKNIEEKSDPILKSTTKKIQKSFDAITKKIPKGGVISKFLGRGSSVAEELPKPAEIVPSKDIVSKMGKVPTPEVDKKLIPDLTQPTKKAKKFSDTISNIFSKLGDIIKTVWKGIKSTLREILDFAISVVKKIAGGIGDSIQKLLGGIAKGLNQFKTSSLKGAAALLVVSSALWVTSKALQNFASVSWGDVGKGVVSLGALTGAAMLLGKVTGDIIKGSAALAIMGAALIPTAFALKMFSDVNWGDLGKAAIALVGLTAAVMGLGLLMSSGVGSVAIIAGSIALGLMGAAIMPLAIGLNMLSAVKWDSIRDGSGALVEFGKSAATVALVSPMLLLGGVAIGIFAATLSSFASILDKTSKGLTNIAPNFESVREQIRAISEIDSKQLENFSSALSDIGMALLKFSAFNLGSGFLSSITNIFNGDTLAPLRELATLANPLSLVAGTIENLSNALQNFSDILSSLNFDNISGLREVGKIDISKLQPINQEIETATMEAPPGEMATIGPSSMRPIIEQPRRATPIGPTRKSMAQNVSMQRSNETAQEEELSNTQSRFNEQATEINTKTIERLLRELIAVMTQYAARPNQVHIGKSAIEQIHGALRPLNNKLG